MECTAELSAHCATILRSRLRVFIHPPRDEFLSLVVYYLGNVPVNRYIFFYNVAFFSFNCGIMCLLVDKVEVFFFITGRERKIAEDLYSIYLDVTTTVCEYVS